MRIKEELILRKVGEKYMIIDPGTDMVDLTHVYTLNQTAAWLWEQVKGVDITLPIIINLLKSNYGLNPTDAERDALLFLEVLKEYELLEYGGNTNER